MAQLGQPAAQPCAGWIIGGLEGDNEDPHPQGADIKALLPMSHECIELMRTTMIAILRRAGRAFQPDP